MQDEKGCECWVDFAKGIAILLVVFGHVNVGMLESNKFMNDNILWIINKIIYSFHMPLFFILSGYLYGKIEVINNKEQLRKLISKK